MYIIGELALIKKRFILKWAQEKSILHQQNTFISRWYQNSIFNYDVVLFWHWYASMFISYFSAEHYFFYYIKLVKRIRVCVNFARQNGRYIRYTKHNIWNTKCTLHTQVQTTHIHTHASRRLSNTHIDFKLPLAFFLSNQPNLFFARLTQSWDFRFKQFETSEAKLFESYHRTLLVKFSSLCLD